MPCGWLAAVAAAVVALLAGVAIVPATAAAAAPTATVTLSISPTSVPVGGQVTLTATVTSNVGVPTGTVSFVDAASPSTPLASMVPLDPTGVATFQTSSIPQGTHEIYAEYVPDFNGGVVLGLQTTDSAKQTLAVGSTVVVHDTQVVLSTPSLTVDSTAPVTLTATVSQVGGSATPTGSVSFSDVESGSPIPLGNGPVPLVNGVAALTVPDFAPGQHQIVASYNGDSANNPSSSLPLVLNSNAPINPAVQTNAAVTVSPATISAGDTATITVTITQVSPPAATPPPGGSVTFSSNSVYGDNVLLGTAALGTAPPGMTAAPNQAIIQVGGWQTGAYQIVASYLGDIYDHPSNGSVNLSVTPGRVAASIAYTGATSGEHGHSASFSAVVTDTSGNPLAGRSVTFTVGTGSCTATTDGAGNATCSFVLGTDPGATTVTASVARDPQTLATSTDASFTVLPQQTSLQVQAQPGAPTTALSATLLDDTSSPVAGRTVTLTLGSSSCSAVTDASGAASCSVPTPSGLTAALTGVFAGDSTYVGSSAATTVTLMLPTTVTYTGATAGEYGHAVTLSARLTDYQGNVLASQPLSLSLGSQSCQATTDATGSASCTITLAQDPGSLPVTVTFAGSSRYLASSGSAVFAVSPEATSLSITVPSALQNGALVPLTGRLLDDQGRPLGGQTVVLTLGARSCTAVSTSAGLVSCSVPRATVLGPTTVTASFAPTTDYLGSSARGTTILFELPAGGTFVIGDLAAQPNVTFWGAQWWKLNPTSNGGAPSAFKGWATCTGACTNGWTSRPGNSSAPPAAPLPTYMGVIVSSSISKSGSTISGNTVRIVVVRTAPGYAPDPGHAGTGTVVASL